MHKLHVPKICSTQTEALNLLHVTDNSYSWKTDVSCHFTVSIFSYANLNYDTRLLTPNYMHTLEKANFRKHFRAFI